MDYSIKQDGKFKFIEEGEGEPLMMLHGLFGALSNFKDLIDYFKKTEIKTKGNRCRELIIIRAKCGSCDGNGCIGRSGRCIQIGF